MSFNIEGDLDDVMLPPLLFLPIVENAFKHGANEMLEQAWMSLDISVTSSTISFKLINGKNGGDYANKSMTTTGIGLQNLRKRLSLLYPKKHTLKILNEEEQFMVNLQLQV